MEKVEIKNSSDIKDENIEVIELQTDYVDISSEIIELLKIVDKYNMDEFLQESNQIEYEIQDENDKIRNVILTIKKIEIN